MKLQRENHPVHICSWIVPGSLMRSPPSLYSWSSWHWKRWEKSLAGPMEREMAYFLQVRARPVTKQEWELLRGWLNKSPVIMSSDTCRSAVSYSFSLLTELIWFPQEEQSPTCTVWWLPDTSSSLKSRLKAWQLHPGWSSSHQSMLVWRLLSVATYCNLLQHCNFECFHHLV